MTLREKYRAQTGRCCEVWVAGVLMIKDTEAVRYALWLENRTTQDNDQDDNNSDKAPSHHTMTRCPTCGSACTIYSTDEGTNSFEPIRIGELAERWITANPSAAYKGKVCVRHFAEWATRQCLNSDFRNLCHWILVGETWHAACGYEWNIGIHGTLSEQEFDMCPRCKRQLIITRTGLPPYKKSHETTE